jgi:hypothetical protein
VCRAAVAKMKKGVVIVNTSRGALVKRVDILSDMIIFKREIFCFSIKVELTPQTFPDKIICRP